MGFAYKPKKCGNIISLSDSEGSYREWAIFCSEFVVFSFEMHKIIKLAKKCVLFFPTEHIKYY